MKKYSVSSALEQGTSAWTTFIPSSINYKAPGFPYPTANVNLYASGHWTGVIQIPPGASAETVANAALLQEYLERIGGPISIVTTTSGSGIKLGTYAEWLPYMSTNSDYLTNNSNDYVLITRGGTLRINAKNQLSLERAIFRYLEILGYRQFFPTATWEDLPTPRAFNANIGLEENSVINSDKMLAGSGLDIESTMELIASWRKKNRLTSRPTSQTFKCGSSRSLNMRLMKTSFLKIPATFRHKGTSFV